MSDRHSKYTVLFAILVPGVGAKFLAGAILLAIIAIGLFNLLRYSDHPASSTVVQRTDGELLSILAPELPYAALNSLDDLTQSQRQKLASVDGISFWFDGDFNADGKPDLMLLGRYGEGGELRSFALIATREPAGLARVQILTFEQRFIIGRIYDTGPSIFFCIGCDHGGDIRWTGSQYVFEPFTAAGIP